MHLNRKIILFFFLAIVNNTYGQWTSENSDNYGRYGDISDGLPDKDTLVTKCNDKEILTGIGKIALDGKELSNLKAGHWKEYNSNGILKREGNYKIGSYIQCCFAGPCNQYYHYKSGIWKYYDDEGSLSYELEFVPSKIHIVTSCEGGDDLLFGLVENIPIEYDDIVTTDTIVKHQKVEMDHEIGTITMVPLNGRLYWE
ncbi:MAG: hypothetical protein ABJN95_11140 [Maribacter sp.]|uniref:hypothetical protein n=1 Tax=Maribacter sp. TaxID=1897614 RepID=UPI00329A7AD1